MSIRYGKMTQLYTEQHSPSFMNIGDIVQTLAVEHIYETLGINSDVVGVSKYGLANYEGDELIIPITGFFNERPDMGEVPFSEKIHPIFWGYHCGWGLHDPSIVESFKRYQSVGCRDLHSYKKFVDKGVAAYVCGCPTITFDTRDENVVDGAVFLVDVPSDLPHYIPEELKSRVQTLSHIVEVKSKPLSQQEYEGLVRYTRDRLDKYKREASLVVTGRIHCVLPCIAMGIPVVFVTDSMHETHEFLVGLTTVYTKEQFSNINWFPDALDVEHVKHDFLKYCDAGLKLSVPDKEVIKRLQSVFAVESGAIFHEQEVLKLKEIFSKDIAGNYIIWGVGALGAKLYSLVCEYYPNMNLVYCLDTYAKSDFMGRNVVRPEDLPISNGVTKVLAATSYDIKATEIFLESKGYVKGLTYQSMLVHQGMI